MTRRSGPRRGHAATAALSLAIVMVAVYLVPSGGAWSPTTASAPPSFDAAQFAEHAGYSPSTLENVTDLSPSTGTASVVVTFNPSNPTLFDAPAASARPLTPAELGARYGLSLSAYQSAENYFIGEGLSIEHAGADRLSLTVQGPVDAVDHAFDTVLVGGNYDGRAVRLPSLPPSLPASIGTEVSGVTGLSSGLDRFTLPLTQLKLAPGATPSQGPNDLVTPSIARQIYDASSLYNFTGSPTYASGEKIVLLLWGDGYNPNDLATFFSNDYPSGLFPTIQVDATPIDGAPQPAPSAVNDPSGAPEELTLDLEWSGSLAPGATLDPVYAPDGPSSDGYSPTDSSMADALHFAVTGIAGVDAISMSFGTAENTASGLESAWTTDLAEAAQEKITLLAATGDTGGDTSMKPDCSNVPQPNYPASDPGVMAVGGTDPSLARNVVGQVTGIASEAAWAGSGGGYSTDYPAPSWQEVGSARAPIEASGFRGMPDVSASAADNFVYYDGQEETGGTSFATPLWAGLITEMDALHGGPLGFVTPRLYYIGSAEPSGTVAEGLADITAGANCLGTANVGWDTATGWGSPRALDLYADLTSTFVNLSIAATPTPVGPGASLTVAARLANATTDAPIAGVTVLVSLTADTTFGPCDGTFGTASPATNASGEISVTMAVPACYLGSHAVATVSVMSDGLFGTNQSVVGVNLLGYLSFLGPASTYPGSIAVFAVIMGSAIVVGYVLGRGAPHRRVRYSPVLPTSPPTGTAGATSAPAAPGSAASGAGPSSSAWVVNPPTYVPAEPTPPTPSPPGSPPPSE